MTEEDTGERGLKETITRGGCRFVALWAAGLLLLYSIGGYFGFRALQGYRAETENLRQAFIGPEAMELDTKAPEIGSSGKPIQVRVGIYVNSIGEFALREGRWTADFDIWFRWTGEGVKPGENFQIINGEIDQREKQAFYVQGGERFERYRVKARLTKFFDASRFPFSDDALTIQVEDGFQKTEKLRYVAEERESGASRLGIPQNLAIKKILATVKNHSYGSSRGDPSIPPGKPEVHSRFVFAMLISPPSLPIYLKNFQALFASVAIAFIVFFIRPIHVDPRFGLGVGAAFAAIANNIFVGSFIPATDRFTLTAMVNTIGLATIFLTLVQSAISLYIEDTMGQEGLRRYFDKVSFAVFLIGYTATNLVLPLAARS